MSRTPAMPTSVRVGPYTYAVVCDEESTLRARHDEDDSHLMGRTEHQRLRVVIAHDIAPDCQRETLVHEVLHIAFRVTDISRSVEDVEKYAIEEHAIGSLSPVLRGILRDNPELVAYLIGFDL